MAYGYDTPIKNYSVPFGQTARSGKWETCPGREILRGAPSSRLVAEDLGTVICGLGAEDKLYVLF